MNVAAILRQKGRAVTTASPTVTLLDVANKLAAKRIGAIVVVGARRRGGRHHLRARHHPRPVRGRARLPDAAGVGDHDASKWSPARRPIRWTS